MINALLSRNESLRSRLASEQVLHAPHLLDVELLHTLRRLVRLKTIDLPRAARLRDDFSRLAIVRYPHEPLADEAWALRDRMSAYDAVFVALSRLLEVPLVTCDAKLKSAAPRGTKIELY